MLVQLYSQKLTNIVVDKNEETQIFTVVNSEIDKHLRITETSPFSLLMVKLLIVIVSLYGCSPESV